MDAKMLLLMCCYLIVAVCSTRIIVNEDDLNDLRLDMLSLKEEMQLLRSENALLKTEMDRLNAMTATMMDTIQTQREENNALHEEGCHSDTAFNALRVLDRDTNETIADTTKPSLDNTDKAEVTDDDVDDVASNTHDGIVISNKPSGIRKDREGCAIKKKRVAIEQGVAFSATVSLPNLVNLGQGQTIIFDNVISNLGNAYDNRVGIFRVPVDGWYVFSLTVMSDWDHYASLEVAINGIGIFHCYGSKDHFDSGSKTVVKHANRGDNVLARTASWDVTDTILGYDHTSFTGFLLYAD